jgi:O-acetylhomoserine (thiol)-lyase
MVGQAQFGPNHQAVSGWSHLSILMMPTQSKAAPTTTPARSSVEAIANPGGHIMDVRAVADLADAAGILLIIDNTTATLNSVLPGSRWRDAGGVHSTTKYLTGNGTVTAVVWWTAAARLDPASDKFPELVPARTPRITASSSLETFNRHSQVFHETAIGLRDLA